MNQDTIRTELNEMLKENGMKLKFVADKTDIEYTTLSKWKNSVFDFGADKLNEVKRFINTYKGDK